MATTIISADVINVGSNLQYQLVNNGDIFVLTSGTRLIADGYSYIYGIATGIDVTIDGYVWLEGNQGSPFYFSGDDDITIGPDAQMVLTSNTSLAAVSLGVVTGGTQFVNYGHITTRGGPGLNVAGGSNTLRNFGTIELTNGSFRYGSGSNDTLLNAGLITGQTSSSAGIVVIDGADNALTNTGDILTARLGGYGVIDNSTLGTTTIVNTGNIISGLGTGVGTNGANIVLTNSGTISGPNAALNFIGGNNTVVNTGHLIGNVVFGFGDDTFKGIGGTLTGTIAGGAGGDTYHTSDSAMNIIEIAGGGTDKVVSTVDFRLDSNLEELVLQGAATRGNGNASGNIITGNAADNRLFGHAGADSLIGNEGDDVVGGGSGNDTLRGSDGNDVLRGADDNDSLFGGGDNDRLTGGLGVDTLSGGSGADDFVFTRRAESGSSVATSDLISDFAVGQDTIDLSAIDANTTNASPNNAFIFIATGAFTNVAGELRFSSAAGVTTVQMDTNGNGVADMSIRLTGTLSLTASDFIL